MVISKKNILKNVYYFSNYVQKSSFWLCVKSNDLLSHLVLEKQTKCIPICMPGSSFIHIVDINIVDISE
jgi:hypothetical protein